VAAFALEPKGQQLVDMVTSAMVGNYSAMESAKLTMRETSRDRSTVDSRETIENLPDGRMVKVFHSPEAIATLRIVLREKDFRCERRAGAANAGKIVEVHGLLDGYWTQYVPSISTGWIRLTDQLPSLFPLDPRQSGAGDIRRRLGDILKEDKILRAEMLGERDTHRVQIVTETARGAITTYRFSANARFLPTRFHTRWEDGSLLQLVDIEYQTVLDGNALFPKRITRRFYDHGKAVLPDTKSWRQEMMREVVGPIQFNTPIDDAELAVTLPPDTRVVNVARGTIRGVCTSEVDWRPVQWREAIRGTCWQRSPR
jgi:hypothetical protein